MNASSDNTIVMKFGGTSVGSIEKIHKVAQRISEEKKSGKDIVVVVSAMSGETDRLIDLANQILRGKKIPSREYGQLVTSGEQVSSALVAMAIMECGFESQSLLAPQVGLRTSRVYGTDLIDRLDVDHIKDLLSQGIIPVIAGFQGIGEEGHLTTLGRGGSDTTAVAWAAAFGSCLCYICTDVDGVYSALPSICPSAIKRTHLNYEEMMELASSGAKVLHTRSVSLAHRFKVPLCVCSSFEKEQGTFIIEEYEGMEHTIISGISGKTDEARLTLRQLPDNPGTAAAIFKVISDAGIIVDMIVQSVGQDGKAQMSFSIMEAELSLAQEVLNKLISEKLHGTTLDVDPHVSKISIVGVGMKNHSGVAFQMFDVLSSNDINIEMITTSEIKISVIIDRKHSDRAIRLLHESFVE